ncbi:hypothetical protein BGZ94_008775 [Podila epigama]|nr:hypothetical protein BGZ94_008775 [Podila epigama]
MPSITLNNPEDKATVKRFLSSPNTRIITATVARLYITYPDPHLWTYSGIMGAVALIQTSQTFYLRIVDLLASDATYIAGFSFADEHEADVFYGKVSGRTGLRPFKPVPSANALARSGKTGGAQGRSKIPMHNGKLDKSRIGLPSDFRHIGHIGWDPDVGFDAQNIDPSWRALFEQLDKFGVSRQQIDENATFITEFVNARGGLTGSKAIDEKRSSAEDLARIDSPPLLSSPRQTSRSPGPLLSQSPSQRRPPPPPPPVQTSTAAASLVSPAPYHGYLPRPLAQVMASLSFGSSSFYGSSPSSSVPSAPDTSTNANSTAAITDDASSSTSSSSIRRSPPQSPRSPVEMELPDSKVNHPSLVSSPPPLCSSPPPPPPPPPPPMAPKSPSHWQRTSPGVNGVHPPLSINTANLGAGMNHERGTRTGEETMPSVTSMGRITPERGVRPKDEGMVTPSAMRSPVESSLLASIRESGGLQGLRKAGKIRSPPPREKMVRSYASSGSLATGESQGDLVSALVAALQRRQTKVTYSDDEDESDDAWDVDD